MNTPVILAAFGTASHKAADTYRFLDQEIRKRLPETPLFWSYSSQRARNTDQGAITQQPLSPLARLAALAETGYQKAIVQPLHILPGREFHLLFRECLQSPIPYRVGTPLLTSPQDYLDMTACLAPLIDARSEQAILLVGHGTSHPIWVAYLAIEKIFRQRFGDRIFVGVIEKNPDSSTLPGEIAAAGFKKVCMIPLLLVAGMHYARDVNGEGEHSWRSRLEHQGLEVTSIDAGLGSQLGVVEMITTHITQTLLVTDQ